METLTAAELLAKKLPPTRFVVPGFIQEGLTFLGGRPKVGKSWLSLNTALAVASGAEVLGRPTELGDVLYMALEDHPRRLQDRLQVVLRGSSAPKRLHLATFCPTVGNGGIEAMEQWCKRVECPRLIVIDVYARIRQRSLGSSTLYEADYSSAVPLKSLADQHKLAVLVVTHTRKEAAADDPLDAISATTGLAGAADAILVLSRDPNGARLIGRGRDLIDDIDVALAFDRLTGWWRILGDTDEARRSQQQTAIIQALKAAGSPLSPKDIAKRANIDHDVAKHLVRKLTGSGVIEQSGRGLYVYPVHSVHLVHQPPVSELSL
jgi:predicted transcriptional regulator